MTTDRFDKVIERADRVMRQLDERDGAVRDAARRERQRLNSEVASRIGRVGVAIGVISLITIVVGLLTPIGMFGFLAAVGVAIGVAALLSFLPTQRGGACAQSGTTAGVSEPICRANDAGALGGVGIDADLKW